MRLTLRQYKFSQIHQIKQLWKRKGQYIVHQDPIPAALRGKEITEATDLFKKKPPVFNLPDEEDFGYTTPMTSVEQCKNYREETVYELANVSRFSEGMKQACILSKSQHFQGFPDQVQRLIGKVSIPDQDTLVQREIMRSQLWYNRHEKLPRRIDHENLKYVFRREFGIPFVKQGDLLMTGLLTLAQRIAAQKTSSSLNRRLVNAPALETHYIYEDKRININSIGDCLITGKTQLSPFGDSSLVEASVSHKLPDMFPVYPTIDLRQTNTYTDKSQAVWKEDPEKYVNDVPLTMYRVNTNFWSDEQKQAYSLMLCLGYAVTLARAKYGPDVKDLPEPITIQNVNMNWNTVNFLFFQLNTADFTSDKGVKNFVWTDSGNVLFSKKLPQPWKGVEDEFRTTHYHSYNKEVFSKFLAVHLNGLTDLKSVEL